MADDSRGTGTTEPDYSRYENPMRRLADVLGDDVEYPPPSSDTWLRVVLIIAPCGILILVSVLWPPGAAFLLTFAGAFASIQLAEPYKAWVRRVNAHLAEAREQDLSAIEWTRVKVAFHTSPKLYVGMKAVGHSPAGRLLARLQFPKLSRRWQRSFADLSFRTTYPGSDIVPPATFLKVGRESWRRFSAREYIGAGRTKATRILRLPIAAVLSFGRLLLAGVIDSRPIGALRVRRAERTLTRVGKALIRATADENGDLTVVTLASQLGLTYRKPRIRPGWTWPRTDDGQSIVQDWPRQSDAQSS